MTIKFVAFSKIIFKTLLTISIELDQFQLLPDGFFSVS